MEQPHRQNCHKYSVLFKLGLRGDKIKEAEDRGATKDELLEIIGVGKTKKGMFEGNLEEGELEIGQVSSMINEVLSVKYIFSKLKKEYSIALNKTDKLIKTL